MLDSPAFFFVAKCQKFTTKKILGVHMSVFEFFYKKTNKIKITYIEIKETHKKMGSFY